MKSRGNLGRVALGVPEKLHSGSVFEVLFEECESMKQSGEGSSWGRAGRVLGAG